MHVILTDRPYDPTDDHLSAVLARIDREEVKAVVRRLWNLAGEDPDLRYQVLVLWERRFDGVLKDAERLHVSLLLLTRALGEHDDLRALQAELDARFPWPDEPETLDELIDDLERAARRAAKQRVIRPLREMELGNERLAQALDELEQSPWFQCLGTREKLLAELDVIEQVEGVSPETERIRQDILRLWPPTPENPAQPTDRN